MNLDRLFYPESIAVIGASPNPKGGRLPYYQVLRGAGYQGRLYPVNPAHQEIDGVKVYPSVAELPESVDLAIVGVPVERSYEALESVVDKGIRFVHFFTSGYSEIGDRALEEAMVRRAREGGTRIVGPNCIGVYCSASRVTFGSRPDPSGTGEVAFLGQSGGVTLNFMRMAESRRLRINKAISCGNQIDLGVGDYIDYFGRDEDIKVIAAYIEDVKDGRAFLAALAKTAPLKPVVILRGGATSQGARAAHSHTGALCGPQPLFAAAVRQHGGLEAETLEQLMDVITLAVSPKCLKGRRIGYLGAGGGTSVLFTDLASKYGFSLPELEPSTQERIYERMPRINTSAANPVDLGAAGRDLRVMDHVLRAMDLDANLDGIVAYFPLEFAGALPKDKVSALTGLITTTIGHMRLPVVSVFSTFCDDDLWLEEGRIQVFTDFREARLPAYRTLLEGVEAMDCLLGGARTRG